MYYVFTFYIIQYSFFFQRSIFLQYHLKKITISQGNKLSIVKEDEKKPLAEIQMEKNLLRTLEIVVRIQTLRQIVLRIMAHKTSEEKTGAKKKISSKR